MLSWDAFSGRRLFTTNLVYKLISSNPNCGQITVSTPAVGIEARREIVPCFETIAVLQAFLSVAAWLWLAFVVSRHLKTPFAKLLAPSVLVLFAITPQIAEWNSILSSESLSLSLFALSLGLLIEIAFSIADEGARVDGYIKALYAFWLIFFALWVFVRDTNLIAIPVTLLLLAPIYFSKMFSTRPLILALTIILIVLFAIGSLAARQSPRWPTSVQETLESWIFPFPARTQFLSEHFGMPAPDSPAYKSWFDKTGPTAYSMFLLSHPGFIVSTVLDNSLVLYISYVQPYYKLAKTNTPSLLSQLGNAIHPGSAVFYLVDTIVWISFLVVLLSGRAGHRRGWIWALTWLYLTAGITLLLSFMADSGGVMRHILPYLEMFRLCFWLSLIVLTDAYAEGTDRPLARPAYPPINEE